MPKAGWNDRKLKQGFERFISDHGRLPKAIEIDELSYLPSSRTIQKRFGGLEMLRERLGYSDTHFGKGIHRSKIAHAANVTGRQLEVDLETELQTQFGERNVHTEKVFHGKCRVDFYIYAPEQNFGIDIFSAQSLKTMQSSVNIKQKKYQYFTEPLYLVVVSDAITQSNLDDFIATKRNPLPLNINLITNSELAKHLKQYTPQS